MSQSCGQQIAVKGMAGRVRRQILKLLVACGCEVCGEEGEGADW